MYLGFVDESYSSTYMFVACAVAREEQWAQVGDGFHAIRDFNADEHGTPADAELHGHEIMGGSDDWAALRGKHREAEGVYKRALRVLRNAGVDFVVRGVDIGQLNARYRYPRPPYGLALQFALERINEHLADRCGGAQIRITADNVHTRAEHEQEFQMYRDFGTPWYRGTKLRYVANFEFGDSKMIDGLQAADLAVYLYRRQHAASAERVPENPKAMATRVRLFDALSPMLLPETGVWHP